MQESETWLWSGKSECIEGVKWKMNRTRHTVPLESRHHPDSNYKEVKENSGNKSMITNMEVQSPAVFKVEKRRLYHLVRNNATP